MTGYIMVTASQAGPRAMRGQTAPAASRTGEKREKRMKDDDNTESIMRQLEDLYD